MKQTSFRFDIIRATLAERDSILAMEELCNVADISRSEYHDWLKAECSRRDRADFQLIRKAYRLVL